MSHLPLDARAILAYLNELGYRNISAEQLREFMKDLRKLIKYEEKLNCNNNKDEYFEGLFRRTTASYRAKKDKENGLKAKTKSQEKFLEENKKAAAMPISTVDIPPATKVSSTTFKIKSSEASLTQSRKERMEKNYRFQETEENIFDGKRLDKKKACLSLARDSCKCLPTGGGGECQSSPSTTGIARKLVEVYKEPQWQSLTPTSARSRSRSAGRSKVNIPPISISTSSTQPLGPRSHSNERRPISTHTSRSGGVMIPKPSRPKLSNNRSNDPVKLYQYYQSEWKHFRNQIPGEINRSDVRWQVRQKLLDRN